MFDPLRRLLSRLDGGPVQLGVDERHDLAKIWDSLASLGMFLTAPPSDSVECASCDSPHSAVVFRVEVEGLPDRWFHRCPEWGAVQVDPETLRRWEVRPSVWCRVLTGRDASAVIPEHVWQLGALPGFPSGRMGWLVVGWRRERDLARRVPELAAPNAVVFVPCRLPPTEVWGVVPPVVIPLADVLERTDRGLSLNPAALSMFIPQIPDQKPISKPLLTLPPGTTWEQVSIHVEERSLQIRVGSQECALGFAECGFADGRKTGGEPVPNQSWALLARLARRGVLETGDTIDTKPDALRQAVSALARILKTLTGLPETPFRSGKRKSYRPRFAITGVGVILNVPPGVNWEQVTIQEMVDDAIRITFDEECTSIHGGEAAMTTSERSQPILLCDVMLHHRLEAIFRRILRGEKIAAPPGDRDLLELAKCLQRFLPADGEPLVCRAGTWRPTFEARSDCE